MISSEYLSSVINNSWIMFMEPCYIDYDYIMNKSKGASKMRKVTMYVPGDEVYVYDRIKMDAVKKEITKAELRPEGAIINKIYYIGEEPFAENQVFSDARECVKDALKTILTKSGYGSIMKVVEV